MIEVHDLTFRYPVNDTPVFSDFSAQFRRGEITAVSGRNGCGKTTLAKLISGILRPSAGCVRIDGDDTSGMDLFSIGRRVGYVFQNPNRQLFCDTVYNEISFGLKNLGTDDAVIGEKVESSLGYFSLLRYRDIYPGRLSHGEKQRLAVACVLALGTDYIILDEPTSGLDIRRQRELGELLVKLRDDRDCGIVVISHRAGFIERFADREVVMTP